MLIDAFITREPSIYYTLVRYFCIKLLLLEIACSKAVVLATRVNSNYSRDSSGDP